MFWLLFCSVPVWVGWEASSIGETQSDSSLGGQKAYDEFLLSVLSSSHCFSTKK